MKVIVNTDGGSRGNPGNAASAFVVLGDGGKLIHQESKYLGHNTNNFAEYTGLLMAIEWVEKNIEDAEASFFLDSELVVKQINRIYKIKNPDLAQIYQTISKILSTSKNDYRFSHVPRSQNKLADKLVNECLDNHLNQ